MDRPIPLETFSAYGLAFQKRFVPDVEHEEVVSLIPIPEGVDLRIKGLSHRVRSQRAVALRASAGQGGRGNCSGVESNDSIYFCLCDIGPHASVAFTGRKGRSWPPQIDLTASCWAAPEIAEQLEDLTIRFFRSIGFTNGFASMEYKRDQRDGGFRFVEPTVGRTDGQVEISALCGINVCHVAYCEVPSLGW